MKKVSISKKSLLWNLCSVALTVSVMFSACSKDKVALSVSELVFDANGGAKTVEITSNTAWTVSHAGWLTVTPASGNGNATLTITLPANEKSSPREANVIVMAGSKTEEVTIMQDAADVAVTEISQNTCE